MAALLHLVRHASHAVVGTVLAARSAGVHLSADGRGEAEAMADRLAGEPLEAVYASPRERARETAEPVARRRSLAVRVDPLLDEIDAGGWTGRSFADLAEESAWRRWNAARAIAVAPGGEDAHAVLSRMAAFVRMVAERHPGAAVAAVSHAEPIRLLVLATLGLGADGWGRIAIDPASLSTLALGDGGEVRLLLLNERPAGRSHG